MPLLCHPLLITISGMTPPPAGVRALRFDDQQRLIEDIHCAQCNYNLRMLTRDDVCPECGTSCAASLRDDLLQLYPARWVNRVWWGLALMVAALILFGGYYLVGIALWALFYNAYSYSPFYGVFASVYLLYFWLLLGGALLLPQPNEQLTTFTRRQENILLRTGLVVWLIISNIYYFAHISSFLYGRETYGPFWVEMFRLVTYFVGWLVVYLCIWWWVRHLLLRLPSQKLARSMVKPILIALGLWMFYILAHALYLSCVFLDRWIWYNQHIIGNFITRTLPEQVGQWMMWAMDIIGLLILLVFSLLIERGIRAVRIIGRIHQACASLPDNAQNGK